MKLLNIYNDRRLIYLFTRDDQGNLQINKENSFFPYYYEKFIEGSHKGFDGTPLKKIILSEPGDVRKNRSNNAMEADILFCKRYIIDKIDKFDKSPIKYCFLDIEVLADEMPDVNKADKPISCISVYNSFIKEVKTFYLPDYKTEFEMTDDFIKYMKEEKFDLWLGWNLVGFDFPYLTNRIPDFAEQVSPINKARYGNADMLYPAGTSIVDYLQWFKKITLNREKEYSLNYIAKKHLNEESIKTDFSKLSLELKKKNRNDVMRLVKLEEKKKLISYYDEIRRLAKVEWEDLIWNSRVLDVLLLSEAKNQKIVLPMRPNEERGTLTEKEKYEGAYREIFKKGDFYGVNVYDLTSAYPQMIIDFCLDPSNIISLKEGLALNDSPLSYGDNNPPRYINKIYFSQNPDTLLPIVTKKLITLKVDIKKKLKTLDIKSEEYKDMKMKYDAIKSIVNSAYGVFGNRFFRLYDKKVASSTTYLVRGLLHYVKDKLKKKNYEVIYVDTDSVMINSQENLTQLLNELVLEWGNKYSKKVNIEFEFEGTFERLMLLALCRYRGFLKNEKGIEPISKGLEMKRKDSTTFMKKFQEELIDNKILKKVSKEEIIKWIKLQISEIKNVSLIDIGFPCKLGKKPEEYKNLPIFVRALNNTEGFKKRVGEIFYYIFIKSDSYETIIKDQDLIQTYDKDGNEKGFKNITVKRLQTACKINLGVDYNMMMEEKLRKVDLLKTEKVEIRGKAKDIMAFDEENQSHITREMIDWDMVIRRNILMKLDTVFEAMGWDIKEIIGEPKIIEKPLKLPKTPSKTSTDKPIKPYYEEGKGQDSPKIEGLAEPIENKEDTKKIKLFEMFAGYGGASFALKKANIPFECMGYSEIKPQAIETYNLNYPNVKNYGNCTQINPQELPDFDLLTGGFPCQDVSMGISLNTIKSEKGYLSKGRTLLFNDILRIAQVKQPKYILLENVKSLTYKNHKKMFDYILTSLDLIGYKVHWKVLSSLDYNTPQRRERVYFACFRRDIYENFSFPSKEIYTNDWRNYIDDQRNFKKVNKTPSRDTMREKCKNITNSSYSYTITLKQDRYPNAGIIDFEDYYRFLTTREQFRLQGFFKDEIKLPNLPNSKLQDLAGDGWDINLVSKIFREMFKR